MKSFSNLINFRLALCGARTGLSTLLCLAVFVAVASWSGVASGQGLKSRGGLPFGKKSASAAPVNPSDLMKLTAGFRVDKTGLGGVLEVRASVADDHHIFSVTQPKGPAAPLRTQISIDQSDDFWLAGDFYPDRDPHIRRPTGLQTVNSEEHNGKVTFSAPVQFAEGVDAQSVTMTVKYKGQTCGDGIGASCFQVNKTLEAKYEGELKSRAGDAYELEDGLFRLSGKFFRLEDGKPSSLAIGAGDTIAFDLAVATNGEFALYPYSEDMSKDNSVTLLALTKLSGWQFTGPVTVPGKGSGAADSQTVYRYEIQVPEDFEQGSNVVSGVLGLQACPDGLCEPPVSVSWKANVNVDGKSSGGGVEFVDEAPGYADAKAAFESQVNLLGFDHMSDAGEWEGYSPTLAISLAFVAGFILNFMPCVLPVIGLKVMSFMQQAGENPRKVILLNIVFCLGMLSVFMLLAFLAVQFGLGWGQQFESLTFKVGMIAVVVVFGLSFFGVWEIPVPGFGGGGLDQKEGVAGAFFKGILTTLLATPCSGPLLIPAVVWATAQPPMLTYAVFASLGLGMAMPYLVLGAMPQLTKHLPKPGPWMETFKQIMGFTMLGTAVFLIGAIDNKYIVSLLTMLLIMAFACWWMGRTSLTAPLSERIKTWTVSAIICAFAVWFSFFVLLSKHELDYQKFSRLSLDEHLKAGRTVLVDFTADW